MFEVFKTVCKNPSWVDLTTIRWL